MPKTVLVYDDVTSSCERSQLTPYPVVTTSDPDVTITNTLNATTGQTTYDIAVDTTTPTIPEDTVSATAAANSLTEGTSAGNVNKPTTAPATLADVNGADDRLEVSYQSMEQLFTNRAAETDAGMMNADGSVGGFMIDQGTVAAGGTIPVDQNNNFYVRLEASAVGDQFNMSTPAYDGQLVTIYGPFESQIGVFGEVRLNLGTCGGVARVRDHSIGTLDIGDTSVIMRPNEVIQLRAQGTSLWRVLSHNNNQHVGSGWHETDEGTVVMSGRQAAVNNGNNTANFPIVLSNTNYNIAVTPGLIAGSGGTNADVWYRQDTIGTSGFAIRNTTPFTGSMEVSWMVHGGIPNWVALGGMASF